MNRAVVVLAAALAGLSAGPAPAQTPPAAVTVANAWSRATPPGAKVGAVYMTLASPTGDALVSVSTPAAASAQVHATAMDGPVMRMREIEGGLPLPAGQAVTLQPGGDHVMLMGLNAPLKQGQTVRLHLTFKNAPPADVQAVVGGIGATSPPDTVATVAKPASKPGPAPAPMPGMRMP